MYKINGKVYFNDNELIILKWTIEVTRQYTTFGYDGIINEKLDDNRYKGIFECHIQSGLYPDIGDTVVAELFIDENNCYQMEATITEFDIGLVNDMTIGSFKTICMEKPYLKKINKS